MVAFGSGITLGSGVSVRSSAQPILPPSVTVGTLASSFGFNPEWNVRADYGYALGASGGISDLIDLSGNGRHFSQGVETSQPLWVSSDPAANGASAVQGDGEDDCLTNTFSRGVIVAGTASTHVWLIMVAAQTTWTANDTLWSDGGAQLFQNTTSGGMRIYCGTTNSSQNNNLSGYKYILAQFIGTSSSSLKIGSSTVSGINVGTAAGGTNVLLAAPGGVRFFNGKFTEAAMGFGDIVASAPCLTAISNYCSARYGSGVLA